MKVYLDVRCTLSDLSGEVKRTMFTSAKIRNGSTYLENHLSANDYYAKGERVKGQWVGQGAESLGLSGEVRPEDFEALRINQRPATLERLTPRTKGMRQPTLMEAARAFRAKEGRSGTAQEIANFRLTMKPVSNRVAFFDFQCSAQKSVSILAVLGGDTRLRSAHERAARIALGELEQFASRQKNTPVQRRSEITGNMCAAAFTHDASRALDPQLHTHFVIANATRDRNGKWYALSEYEMIGAVRYAGKVYQNEMARAVRELGYGVRQTRQNGEVTGFEIEGVSDALCERFSKRREEIEREIKKFEERQARKPAVREIALITRETRPGELREIATSEVLAAQRSQLSPEEWHQLQAVRAQAEGRIAEVKQAGDEHEALRASVAHLFERKSVLREQEVLAEALNHSLGHLDLETLKQTVAKTLVRLAPCAENGLLSECCTLQGLELEQWVVKYVDATKGTCPALHPGFVPGGHLSREQREAVASILETRDRVFSFRGVAGAGKTTTLREVQRGLKEAGHSVIAIAPTSSAARVLRDEGFAEATTVEDFLRNGEKRGGLRRAVVICDEAGLKSNRQGAELLRLAQKHDLRVLLVGDVRQHVSVEAGDFLRVLETHSQLGRCRVEQIHRQRQAAYRGAVERMAAGDVRGGLAALDRLDWIKESQSNYLEKAAADYLRLTGDGKQLDRCLAVSFTWEENHRFTDAIRSGLKERGVLPAEGTQLTVHESLRWTDQQKKDWRRYERGQVVTFAPSANRPAVSARVVRAENKMVVVVSARKEMTLNLRRADSFDVARPRQIEVAPGDKVLIRVSDKRLGLINGQVLTVAGIAPDGALTTGEGVSVPAEFRQWCHGYVVTSHKAQGWTADHVVVAAERFTSKGAYVACSRGRESCVVHTPDKDRLMDMIETKESDPEAEDRGEVVERPGVRVSWAWIFPILAAGAVVWLFWSQWKSKGPEIEIQFDDAPGLEAGKTLLIYRGVDAGKVTGVKLDAELSKVIVKVRLKAFAADLAREGTLFWIDQPVISLEETSGLDAIVQGNSLRARMGNGAPTLRFSGLGNPPLTPLEAPALVLKLRAPDIPFLARGATVYHRGVAVGEIEDKIFDEDGLPFLHAVINEEFKSIVRSNSRFWSVPATSMSVGPGGVKLDVIGLAALLRGGVEFDVFESPGDPVKNGAQFELFASESAARCSASPIQISFDDGRGLLAGQTRVCYRGLPVGLVEKVWAEPSNGKIEVVVRLEPGYEVLQNADTIFTLVRPRISLEGVSGLDTLVSGVYIDSMPGSGGRPAEKFVRRTVTDEEWNRAQAEMNGMSIVLRAKEIPSIAKGAPVLYRGIVVGSVKEKALDENRNPFLQVVIREEFERAVQRNARFWRLPATSVQAGPGVLKVDVAGLDTLLQGGVQFDVFGIPGGMVQDGAEFELFSNEHAARSVSHPIRIAFEDGQGFLAGQTQLRYHGIPVGLVEEVTASNGKVEVIARLEPGYDILRRQGSTFSLVRPRISLDGVSGLETLVSGVYIDCLPGPKGKLIQNFVGRQATASSWRNDQGDLEVVVMASTTSISVDAPVYYRGVRVGRVERKSLSSNGRYVHLVVSINQPYARLIRANTKFWDVGGLTASLGFFFLKVPTERLESLVRGGLAFATPDNPKMGPSVRPGHEFTLNKAPRREWLRWAPPFPLID